MEERRIDANSLNHYEGRTLALMISHVVRGGLITHENIMRYFKVIEAHKFGKLSIVPTGLLNEHTQGSTRTYNRREAFKLTVSFLEDYLEDILALNIPEVEIYPFEAFKFQEIPQPIFLKGASLEDSGRKLAEWSDHVFEHINNPTKTLTLRPLFERETKEMHNYYESPTHFKFQRALRSLAAKLRKECKAPVESNVMLLLDEAVLLATMGHMNDKSLKEENKKRFDFICDVGGHFTSFIKFIPEIVPVGSRPSLIYLNSEGEFKLEESKQLSAFHSKSHSKLNRCEMEVFSEEQVTSILFQVGVNKPEQTSAEIREEAEQIKDKVAAWIERRLQEFPLKQEEVTFLCLYRQQVSPKKDIPAVETDILPSEELLKRKY